MIFLSRLCRLKILITSVVFLSTAVFALVPVPELTGRAIDLTGTLSSSALQQIEGDLSAFEAQKGSQVLVLIVPSTAPEAIEQYSIRVVDKWKVGRKKEDDGVLLLIAKEDRAIRIEVGYGLEGALSDLVSKRIISEIITPLFQSGDFSGGINAGVAAILKVVQGEILPPPDPVRRHSQNSGRGLGGGILIAGLAVIMVLRSIFGRLFGGILAGGLIGTAATFILGSLLFGAVLGVVALIFVMVSGGQGGMGRGLGRSGMGGWGGGGGFGGGGFGGGGFSGGGGGFGGGGASGRW